MNAQQREAMDRRIEQGMRDTQEDLDLQEALR